MGIHISSHFFDKISLCVTAFSIRPSIVNVNYGAIPGTFIDSELFGHEKGAFTGALSQKRGRFERANRGTVFLDEIGKLPLAAQVRLLRVLQSHEIERVGGVETIALDIRIIAATNRNLDEVIAAHIRRVLAETGGKVSGPKGAAVRLGVNPSTLRNRMKKLGIRYGMKSVKGKISEDVKN